MKSSILVTSVLAAVVSTGAFADSSKAVYKEHELENGNTVQVRAKGHKNDEGDAAGRRHFRVVDENGDVVRRGADAVRKTADGEVARVKKREYTDEDGNVYQKRARGQKDGEGNARGQRQMRKRDADGNVVARGRDRGRNFEDGTKVRRHHRQRQDANGNRHTRKWGSKRG